MSPPPPLHDPLSNFNSPPDFFLAVLSLVCLFTAPKPFKCPFLSFPKYPRRFRNLPIMFPSQPPSNLHSFATPQSLSDWLKPRLPSDSFASWGVKPGTKNVHNLWLELCDGETCLADSSPPIRTVNVVTVRIIGKNNQILVETRQELSDGSVRNRFRPLAEKMKANETYEEAVFRAVKEELGFDGNNVTIVPGSYNKKVEERSSHSYPGLPALYVVHSVDALVEGLPDNDGEFCTEEAEEYADATGAAVALCVKRHYWKWVTSDFIAP